MPKSPDNMTADERLKRIRSLERKVADLQWQVTMADERRVDTDRWARKAWGEVRRLGDICSLHWNEKQEIRRAAGLEPQPSLIPLAKWNRATREWDPIDPPTTPDGDRPEPTIYAPATTDG